MRKTLAILLASAGLACAELSPNDLNEFKKDAAEAGFKYVKIIDIYDRPFHALKSATGRDQNNNRPSRRELRRAKCLTKANGLRRVTQLSFLY
jgi:hypothetical protein